MVSTVIGVVGLVVVLFLPEVPLRQTHSLSELDDIVELTRPERRCRRPKPSNARVEVGSA